MELATLCGNSGVGGEFWAVADPKDCLRFVSSRSRRTFPRSASTTVRTGGNVSGEGGALFGERVIALGDRVGLDRGVATRAFGRACWGSLFCEHTRLRAVWLNCRAVFSSMRTNESRSLAVIWFHATRLETRTKESDACASLRVTETLRRNESEGEFGSSR